MELTREQASAMSSLVWDWEEVYDISHDGDLFKAVRKRSNPPVILTDESVEQLRFKIRADYHELKDPERSQLRERSSW